MSGSLLFINFINTDNLTKDELLVRATFEYCISHRVCDWLKLVDERYGAVEAIGVRAESVLTHEPAKYRVVKSQIVAKRQTAREIAKASTAPQWCLRKISVCEP